LATAHEIIVLTIRLPYPDDIRQPGSRFGRPSWWKSAIPLRLRAHFFLV